MNKTNKNYKRSQKGRSMVEMLGVLAIVGVLSVGGVYGYGVAMKKHKANELLHQASMLAATISAQAMTNNGTLPQTITDFGNTSYGKFQSAVGETADKTGFTITISELDGSVCSQLKEGGMVRDVDCDETTGDATITYYKNLATNDEEGAKSPTGESGAGGDTKPTTCPTGTSTEGAGGYATTLADGGMCRCETSGTVYKEGTCETKEDNTCSSYADCDKGEYCQFSPGENCETDPTLGVCQSVSGCGMYDIDIGDGKKYTASDYSNCLPDWWIVKDVCASLNMRMVSLDDVGCEDYKGDNCPTEGTVYGALKAKGLKYGFWTTDMYDSCSVWYAGFDDDGYVNNLDRRHNYDFLCVR
ncbi:MAG: type II secretion system protein [Alphaproteobacteria bacterium]|nr:type II secretion system protein [Alphaproteobacteria bacterium]